MELTSKAAEFCEFLYSLAASTRQARNPTDRLQVYNEEYAVTSLPAGTDTPFIDFTGQLKGTSTLIFSKYVPTLSRDNDVGLSPPNNSHSFGNETLDIQEEYSSKYSSSEAELEDKFPCFSYQAVSVGQPLSQKRVYVTQSTPLHSGYSEHLVSDLTIAHDAGVVPLCIEKARYVVSLYALGFRQTKCTSQLPNVWAVCRDEKKNIVALGCSHSIENDNRKPSLQTYTVTAEDVLPNPKVPLTEKQTIKCKPLSSGVGESHAFSEYEIASYSTTEVKSMDEKLTGDLMVQFAWSYPEALLSPPAESSDVVVKISATPGYLFSPGLASYNELNTLLCLCKIATGSMSWSSLTEGLDDEATVDQDAVKMKTLSEKVGSFLEDISSPLSQLSELTVISPTSENKVYEARKDLDFAERLWLFAKDATNLEDLQQIFAEVFKAVLLGKVQPFVHRSSSSVISSLLRKVLLTPNMDEKQDLAPKFQNLLTESKITLCLVQLGIEKMSRDYKAYFVGSDIATGDQLDQFISASQGSLLDQCHTLCKLHCILELMSSALSFLKLPPPTLSILFKSALEVYREQVFKGFATTPVFSLPLPAYSTAQKSLISFCSTLSPKKWVLSQQRSKVNSSTSCNETTVTMYKNQPLLDNLTDSEMEESKYFVYKAHCECI